METSYKCHFCKTCNGRGCIGQLPGMGGSYDSHNFIENCTFWDDIQSKISYFSTLENYNKEISKDTIAIGPMTGAEQNMGWHDEESYYSTMMQAVYKNNIGLTLGDGEPDYKLKYGIEAIKKLNTVYKDAKADVFIKPYPDDKIIERMEWTDGISRGLGIDIDSYNIITMRQTAFLEKKTPYQIKKLMDKAHSFGVPFIIKGIFTQGDIELVKETKPDVAFISNHGGRVETVKGSSGQFLLDHATELKKYCGEIWVDGGIRNAAHIRSAFALGASKVLAGRPFVTALCANGEEGIKNLSKTLYGL